MKVDIYPVLTAIKRDLDNPFAWSKGPWYGRGKDERDSLINATATKFDKQLRSSSPMDLVAYTEGLKPHLLNAITKNHGAWSESEYADEREYKGAILYCYTQLTLVFFTLLLREYAKRRQVFNATVYAASIGVDNIDKFFTEVGNAAEEWGIYCPSSIAELLRNCPQHIQQYSPLREYDLLADYPDTHIYLKRLIPEFLESDYSLQPKSSKVTAAVIAYTISGELNITEVCKYFENFWDIKELSSAYQQAKKRKKKDKARRVLQLLLRKKGPGVQEDIVDTEKVNKYLRQF